MPIRTLNSQSEYDVAVASNFPAVIFKHSPACGGSYLALRVVEAFSNRHPQVPVLMVDVLGQRPLSNAIAEQLGVRHESPQAIVTCTGRATWSGSHSAISVESLASRVAAAAAVP